MSSSTTSTTPYNLRPTSHPLSAYLYKLMHHKRSNLCLSADVSTTKALLHLARTLGPSIILLKTHYDILSGWDSHPETGTGAQLAALARKHGFLIFEDRKFSDIGSTVQKQYVGGPGRVVEWAHITNAHVLPGEAIVTSLASAADAWVEKSRYRVRTEVSVGTPEGASEDEAEETQARHEGNGTNGTVANDQDTLAAKLAAGRKSSIVSVTTVSHHFEDADAAAKNGAEDVYPGIEEAPTCRGLLLLAQMSSAGNLFSQAYTDECVAIARRNKGFVMGYIAQESLNRAEEDDFITMTPGCQLPPAGETEVRGDGQGQQYNTPRRLVGELGTDIIIVGRGIIMAEDVVAEAERYRVKGWEAYEQRIGRVVE